MTDDRPGLNAAYALGGLDEVRRLYADWAESYDATFAAEMDFMAPRVLAKAFADAGGRGPVLDFGAGTGLLGEALAALGIGPVDGADLSEEMLGVARRKGVYRDLVSGNVLDGYRMAGAPYAGVVSSGTFTHGHVGPDAIPILLDLAEPDAQFALTIKKEHFFEAGFPAMFGSIEGRIIGLTLPECRIYGDRNTGPHRDDRMFIALFRKA